MQIALQRLITAKISMKRILSIVFLVIPLLFVTYGCGEEIQATVAPVEVTKMVEKTKTVTEPVETATAAKSVEVISKEETVFKPVAMAASHEEAAKLFKQNCAACHAGGGNLVNAQKTLKKDALEKYDMYSKEAIVYQVVNGKNAMPEGGKTFIFRADRKPCRICFGSS